MQRDRENNTYLPGVALPAGIRVTHEIPAALERAHIVLGAMPSVHARGIYSRVLPRVSREMIFVSATKGREPATHLRMSKVIAQILTQAPSTTNSRRIAALSGPSFAAEAARGERTAVVLASQDAAVASELQEEFAAPSFRLYPNPDILAADLAGAMKKVTAMWAGP